MHGALISSAHHFVRQPTTLNGIVWAFVRAIRSDLNNAGGRYLHLENYVRSIPGEIGFEIRRWALGRYFKKRGPGLRLFPGIRLFGVDQLAVGKDCWIGFDNVIQANGGVEIGDNVLLGPGVKIWSVNHIYSDAQRAIVDQGFQQKRVVIGSNVWIGANAFIMPGARIPDGVIISAGSVVGAKVIEPYAVIAGNPARKIGSRLPGAEDSRFAALDPAVQNLLTV